MENEKIKNLNENKKKVNSRSIRLRIYIENVRVYSVVDCTIEQYVTLRH